ncbi:hypothetical protein B484DRAFT_478939 [Ochromonadaceae sp. CCMP2298]|nr:hypothetical protein B484DRAFT_478939 [Ochromonadaceae sp. CCMP2298]
MAVAVALDPGLATKIAANPALYAEDVDMNTVVAAAKDGFDTDDDVPDIDNNSDSDDEDLFDKAPLTQWSPVRSPSRRGPELQPEDADPFVLVGVFEDVEDDNFVVVDAEREDQAADPFADPFVLVQPAPSIGSGWAFDFFPYSSQPYSQPAEDASLDTISMQRDVSLDLQALILADEDAADPPTEFETSPSQLQCDWGCSDPSWICFKMVFLSAARYEGNVVDVLFFHELQEDCEEKTLCKSMIKYFQELHEAGYAPTTLRSKFSCIKKFYLHTGRGDLSLDCPIIESNLQKWDKTHTIKQARVFNKEDFVKLYALPITPTHALWHAFAAVGTAIAGCGDCDRRSLLRDREPLLQGCQALTDEDGIFAYHIEFDRAKKQTSTTSEREVAILKCPLGVAALER